MQNEDKAEQNQQVNLIELLMKGDDQVDSWFLFC